MLAALITGSHFSSSSLTNAAASAGVPPSILFTAIPGSLGPSVGIVGRRLMLGDGLLGTGDEWPAIADRPLIHVARIAPELLLGSALRSWTSRCSSTTTHRDASVNGGKLLGLILGSDPVRERGEPMMELLPEFDAVIDRPPLRDGAEIDDLDLASESLAFQGAKSVPKPVVRGSKEKPPRERETTGQRVLGSGSAEVLS